MGYHSCILVMTYIIREGERVQLYRFTKFAIDTEKKNYQDEKEKQNRVSC